MKCSADRASLCGDGEVRSRLMCGAGGLGWVMPLEGCSANRASLCEGGSVLLPPPLPVAAASTFLCALARCSDAVRRVADFEVVLEQRRVNICERLVRKRIQIHAINTSNIGT